MQTPRVDEKRAYRIPEFCWRYGIGRSTAYKLAKEGRLRLVKIGNRPSYCTRTRKPCCRGPSNPDPTGLARGAIGEIFRQQQPACNSAFRPTEQVRWAPKRSPQMSQFRANQINKSRRTTWKRGCVATSSCMQGRSAFVDRPDDGVRGRRLVPRLFPEGRQANATYASRMMHEARPAPQGIRGRPVTRTTAITAGRRSARIQP